MDFFFNKSGKGKSEIVCPRCLGKGNVDWNDIERLQQQLKWIPGDCAYCDAKGKVDSSILDKIPADTTYLVNSLPENEKNKLLDGNAEAWLRAKEFERNFDNYINQICYLHNEAKLENTQITDFFMLPEIGSPDYEIKWQEVFNYVEKVLILKGKL